MKVSWKLGKSAVYLLAFAVAGAGGACSSSDNNTGTGGSSGSGGHTGTGGATTVGTGGHTGVGGSTTGTGGSTTGTGGSTAGTGGATTTTDAGPDAVTGTGGASGDAGPGTDAAVDGPPAIVGTALATFDTTNLGFLLSSTPANVADAGAFSTMTWDGNVGDPTPGSLDVTAAFSGYNQQVAVQMNLATHQDWTGKTKLHVRVRLDGGTGFNTDTHFPGGAQVYAQSFTPGVDGSSGTYPYASQYNNVTVGSSAWVDYVLDLTNSANLPTGWDPSNVAIFGLQMNTGNGGGGVGADGGAATNPAPATFHIDSFSIE